MTRSPSVEGRKPEANADAIPAPGEDALACAQRFYSEHIRILREGFDVEWTERFTWTAAELSKIDTGGCHPALVDGIEDMIDAEIRSQHDNDPEAPAGPKARRQAEREKISGRVDRTLDEIRKTFG